MSLETESRGLMRRLVVFYVILAAITVGVVIFVVNQGKDEKAQPAIAGVYQSAALNSCIGPAPKPVGGAPLPPSAPTYGVSWKGVPLGKVTYSDTTGSVAGDIACARGGTARITAIANDRNLTNVTIIPLQVGTPVPSTASLPKPALTTPSGLSPS